MPPKSVKGAQKSSAQATLSAKGGAPDGLSSFLGGFVAGGGGYADPSSPVGAATPQQEQEGAMAMNLRLLSKKSDITKQKSLNELCRQVATAREDSLCQFVPSIAEAVIQHANHLNPQVRASVFALLKVLMRRGKETKLSLVPSLPALAPEWVMGMHDMEGTVRQEAKEAFDAAFRAEKRPAMLLRYSDDILRVLFEDVTDIATNGKPLLDDQQDKRANRLYSAMRAIGFMTKRVSASQTAITAFVVEQPAFLKVLPLRTTTTAEKGFIAEKTPLVRSAALSLLRDVISVCPCTTKLHRLVGQAVQGSVMDPNPTVAARVWELLLLWCRANLSEMVANLPNGLLDEVIDCFMECRKPELGEVIFPCLFPLLTQLSKDPKLPNVLDEFCGALVEKLRLLGETPNVSALEIEVVFRALMECWELHCVRKKGTPAAADCEELFTVVLSNLVALLQPAPKRRRYQEVVITILTKSLLKTAIRNEFAFKHCMAVLTAQPEAPFKAVPDDGDAASVRSYENLRAAAVGTLYATAVHEGTYSHQLPMLEAYVVHVVDACIAAKDTSGLLAVLKGAGSAYHPSRAAKDAVVDHLLAAVPNLSTTPGTPGGGGDEDNDEEAARCTALLAIAFSWDDKGCVERLGEISQCKVMGGVQEAVKDHLLKDPAKAFDILVLSCEEGAFADVRRCVQQLTSVGVALSEEQRRRLLHAVVAGLTDTLRLAKGDDATMEREKREAAGSNPSSTSSTSSTSSRSGSSTDEDQSDSDSDGGRGEEGSSSEVSSVASGGDSGGGGGRDGAPARERRKGKKKKTDSSGESSDDSANGDEEDADGEGKKEEEEEEEEERENRGAEVLDRTAEWVELLLKPRPLARLLALDTAAFSSSLSTVFYRLTAAVAPPLLPEHYLSIRGLRVALERQGRPAAHAGEAEDDDALLCTALEEKTHSLRSDDFGVMVAKVGELLESYALPAHDRDAFASAFMTAIVDGRVPLCCEAFHQFQQAVPFASHNCLRRFVHTAIVSEAFPVRPRRMTEPSATTSERLSLFDGYLSLADIEVTLFSVVRTAQLLRLMDYCGAIASPLSDSTNPTQEAAQMLHFLLTAAVVKEAFSEATCAILFSRLLPQALERVDSRQVAAALTSMILDEANESAYLLVTLAAVLRDTAHTLEPAPASPAAAPRHGENEERLGFLLRGRRLASAVTSTAVDALFTSSGARGIDKGLATIYANFFSVMDETADTVKDNLLAQLPKPQEALFMEACMMLPTWDLTTASLSLILHRHLASMPVVTESTVKSLIEYAQKQSPLDGLELLSELSMTRILDPSAYSEVVRVIAHALCRCYTLRHLPTNGRLSLLPQGRPAPAPPPFHQLRRIAVAAVVARRGVVIHSRADDVLRSTVNLVVFDIVCEAVSRLRSTREDEVPMLVRLIGFTTTFMSELLTSDVTVLRASEASVNKIASVLCFAYLWVSVTPIARIEAIGVEAVSAVLRSVCQLANLTLMRSTTSLHRTMRAILDKASLKPLRTEFSSSAPMKTALYRRHNRLISKTQKQKLLLFPYLLAYAIALTSAPPKAAEEEEEAAASSGAGRTTFKDRRNELCRVLDLILSLLFTPYTRAKGARVEDTFLGSAVGVGSFRGGEVGNDRDANPFAGVLGFEVAALTRADDLQDPMGQLARGAASVFTLLLSGDTLPFVKGWLETLERKLQALLYDFVEVYVVPTLVQENLLTVLSHSPDGATTFNVSDEVSVHVGMAQRVIDISYTMEDMRAGVSIHFPTAYPLRQPIVNFGSGRECGISNDKWRAWMLKMTALLFSGASSTWECVELFQRNLDAHLGGQEPCPICYAVVHAVNHKLPDMRCSICHNSAFHSGCLYTWWANGGQNVCPLCRSPWISE